MELEKESIFTSLKSSTNYVDPCGEDEPGYLDGLIMAQRPRGGSLLLQQCFEQFKLIYPGPELKIIGMHCVKDGEWFIPKGCHDNMRPLWSAIYFYV